MTSACGRRCIIMNMKPTVPQKIFNVFNYTFMFLMIILCVYPLWHIVCASFSNPTEYLAHRGLLLWPLDFSTAAYEKAFHHPLIVKSYLNTLFILVVGT